MQESSPIAMLDEQGEQLNRIEGGMDQINKDAREAGGEDFNRTRQVQWPLRLPLVIRQRTLSLERTIRQHGEMVATAPLAM